MPATYERMGIRFDYPENWQVDEQEARNQQNAVTVYSPGGAFWSVSVESRDSDPQELTRAALAAMRQEYEELDAYEVSEQVEDKEMVGYDMNFYCLDLTNTAQVRSFRTWRATYVIICQAEDREVDEISPVFQAMKTSLVR